MGAANVGTLRFEIYWAGDRPDLGPRRLRLVVRRTRSSPRPRANGVTTLPFVTSAPAGCVRARRPRAARSATAPPYAPRGKEALAAWRTFLADAVERYGPDGSFWDAHPDAARAADPRLADLERAELAQLLEAEAEREGVREAARLRPHGDHRRRPGGEDHPRRHVRDPARRAQAGDLRLGLPREALSPEGREARLRWRRSAPVRVEVLEGAGPDRPAARRHGRRPRPRRRALDHRDRLGFRRRPEPAQPRARRAGRPAAGGVQVLHRKAPQAQRRGADLVLVARQHRGRRAACASGARSRVC